MTAVKTISLTLMIGLIIGFLAVWTFIFSVRAQDIESDSFKIINTEVNTAGGALQSENYDLFAGLGAEFNSTKLQSENYSLSNLPPDFQASIPSIVCFESTTNQSTSECLNIPGDGGMESVCGEPGCYDRAKIEIDDQGNPTDALYLVAISTDNFQSDISYLQSDHTLGASYDINDFLTQCELEGYDPDDTACDDSGDANWNEALQKYNVLNLNTSTDYYIAVKSLNGDFTETSYSAVSTNSTTFQSIGFDIDVSNTDTETTAPYYITFGTLSLSSVTEPFEDIWLDLSTNNESGMEVRISSTSSGLYSLITNEKIPSESEDLNIDDGDGGYGAKIVSNSELSLGPLIADSFYSTANATTVGKLNLPSFSQRLFYTEKIDSNLGILNGGRGRIRLMAKSYSGLPSGTYTDQITFTVIAK